VSDFVSKTVSLSASTATRVVDASEFSRRVLVGGDTVRVAYTSADASTGAKLNDLRSGSAYDISFVLPAGQELYAYSSGAATVSVLTTGTD
jgi:hypothetical protein